MTSAITAPDDESMAIVEPKDAPTTAIDRIREIEDRLMLKAATQVENALAWDEIDMGAECPAEWIELYGAEGAKRRYRAAQAAQMSNKEAPAGLKLSTTYLVVSMKARATEKAAPRTLNVVVGHIVFQLPDIPRQKVDK